MCGGWRRGASARWMTCLGFWVTVRSCCETPMRQNFAKVARILWLSQKYSQNKFGQVVENLPTSFCLFGFAKATKLSDSSEYSQCVQNVLAKSCLPCQILYKQKNFAWAWNGLGTSLALQCYAGFGSSSFSSKILWAKRWQHAPKVNYSFSFVRLITLSLLSKIVCSLW